LLPAPPSTCATDAQHAAFSGTIFTTYGCLAVPHYRIYGVSYSCADTFSSHGPAYACLPLLLALPLPCPLPLDLRSLHYSTYLTYGLLPAPARTRTVLPSRCGYLPRQTVPPPPICSSFITARLAYRALRIRRRHTVNFRHSLKDGRGHTPERKARPLRTGLRSIPLRFVATYSSALRTRVYNPLQRHSSGT